MDMHTKLMKVGSVMISFMSNNKVMNSKIAHKIIDFTVLFICFFGLFVSIGALPIALFFRVLGIKIPYFFIHFIDDPGPNV